MRLTRSDHRPARAIRSRRDDHGLTTLEWLLIVAAVAGLAALAVVVVQNVVSETAEQIAGSSARLQAADLAAQDITDIATAESPTNDQELKAMNRRLGGRCERMNISYATTFAAADPAKEAQWTDGERSSSYDKWTTDPKCVINDKTP